ncbi:polymerase [Salpingoeca rosetta]|uniref:DNA polymerase n=1 Tax=Salpingoeca rosetta (strain ATCC 50818 / BSB-021) TaxID=946362 RepID=F2UC83_SALR5|nr:polymerase [Salpingoeca rosetta]EGD74190.1 polymerase [Salpingoeca rosetta]|eukprot:XP_004993090.1 polymerase [Salpingoeca rosetta]
MHDFSFAPKSKDARKQQQQTLDDSKQHHQQQQDNQQQQQPAKGTAAMPTVPRSLSDGDNGAKRRVERSASGSKKWKAGGKNSNPESQDSAFVDELGDMGTNGERISDVARPPAKPMDSSKEAFVFQQLDLDSYLDVPLPGMPGPQRGNVQIFRLFGVTKGGNSVLMHVHGFCPFIYTPAPANFTPSMLGEFKMALDKQIKETTSSAKDVPEVVMMVEIVSKESIYGFHATGKRPFLKIYLVQHKFINPARRALEQGTITLSKLGTLSYEVYESNLELNLRFMVETQLVGCNWVEVPAGKYKFRSFSSTPKPVSLAQYELDVAFDAFISHPAEDEWQQIAPLRILSFDIECAGRKGVFPEPDKDPVIQIANMVQVEGESKPFVRNVFTLGTCAPIVGSKVIACKTEIELLESWSAFVRECDPDIVTGYNITNFDLPFLMNRAKHLGARKFPYLGRLRNVQSKLSETKFSSKAYGTRESKVTSMEGRVPLDVLQILQRDYKLRSYTLNSVSAHFLSEQKEDVHHSIITDLQNGNDETRRRLAVYCMKDAYLPLRLLSKLMCVVNYMEMARVTGVPLSYLLSRGQQIKVISQLMRHAGQHDLVIPVHERQGSDEQYEGATVIQPKRGYYDTPIATLDFSSLYPSIMMAHNLCYTTLLSPQERSHLHPDDYIKTPNGDYFVKNKVRKGLLPLILESLLSARKRAKADLKKETDPFRKSVLNGRQLALKISANSVYGFTGATVGKLPCLAISSSVTAFGREMIEATKQHVESRYNVKNGYKHDAVVIYGDTDSVMVKFGLDSLEETMKVAQEAAEYVTSKFIRPINLEFEKVYFPYLLINKKRYAGLFWTRTEKWDKMDCKGLVTVRRDNCPLVVTLINTCLHKLLIERNVEGAIDFAKKTISDLLCNEIDISQLVITKALTKTADEYDGKQAHVELAERMRKRDAGSAPTLGDRVAYVIIRGPKGAPAFEKSEDPIYVLENNIQLDTQYYLHNQLEKPLMSIFEPILGSRAKELLSGEHTRVVVKRASSAGGNDKKSRGSIMSFTRAKATCRSCRALLPAGRTTLCSACEKDIDVHFQRELLKKRQLEDRYARLWAQCQRCQGSVMQDVLCTSKDCPIFYMRKKVQKDLRMQNEVVGKFDDSW